MTPLGDGQIILIVDDSDDDYDATARALQRGEKPNHPLHRCHGGREALDYLYCRGEYAAPNNGSRPGIMLLDLNMPGIDGREVLATVKNDPDLRSIPIIILTNSNHRRDIDACYELGANTYIQKPLDLQRFFNIMQGLKDYWFKTAALPGT